MDEDDFAAATARHRAELRVHCYRMLGSIDDAEDLVQETFLRAWKHWSTLPERSAVRAWLYRVATNACLDFLDGRGRRVLPRDRAPAGDPRVGLAPREDVAWLQPLPDQPDDLVVDKETIELAFLVAIQHLPPRQRAALILRDVLGWPARDTADMLDSSVASANSALQRARATLKEHLPHRRDEWTRAATDDEQRLLGRYMDAVENADVDAVAALLAEDVRTDMPPFPMWFAGRDDVLEALAIGWDVESPHYVGRFRMVATRANGQPAAAAYVDGRAFAIVVLSIVDDRIGSLTAFHDPDLFPRFGLPMSFSGADRCTGHG